MTIEEHMAAVRHQKDGRENFVAALRSDSSLKQEAERRLVYFKELEKANRLNGCWISKFTKETLTAALAVVQTSPDVPAGG